MLVVLHLLTHWVASLHPSVLSLVPTSRRSLWSSSPICFFHSWLSFLADSVTVDLLFHIVNSHIIVLMNFLVVLLHPIRVACQLKSGESVVRLVSSRVDCLQFFSLDCVYSVALLAEVKVKAFLALVPHSLNGVLLTPVALHILLHLLSRLHYQLYSVFLQVTSDLECLEGSSEVAVLTQAKVSAVSADEAGADDGLHIATDALILVVGSQTVSQQGKLNAQELVVSAHDLVVLDQVFQLQLYLVVFETVQLLFQFISILQVYLLES